MVLASTDHKARSHKFLGRRGPDCCISSVLHHYAEISGTRGIRALAGDGYSDNNYNNLRAHFFLHDSLRSRYDRHRYRIDPTKELETTLPESASG
jgi:hypothetical protein